MRILLLITFTIFFISVNAQILDTTKQVKRHLPDSVISSFFMPSPRTAAGLNNLNANSNITPSYRPYYKNTVFWKGGYNGPLQGQPVKPLPGQDGTPIQETFLGGVVREAFGGFLSPRKQR